MLLLLLTSPWKNHWRSILIPAQKLLDFMFDGFYVCFFFRTWRHITDYNRCFHKSWSMFKMLMDFRLTVWISHLKFGFNHQPLFITVSQFSRRFHRPDPIIVLGPGHEADEEPVKPFASALARWVKISGVWTNHPLCNWQLATWWLIPLSKWVITPVMINPTKIPFITGVITHLLSGMSHKVASYRDWILYTNTGLPSTRNSGNLGIQPL